MKRTVVSLLETVTKANIAVEARKLSQALSDFNVKVGLIKNPNHPVVKQGLELLKQARLKAKVGDDGGADLNVGVVLGINSNAVITLVRQYGAIAIKLPNTTLVMLPLFINPHTGVNPVYTIPLPIDLAANRKKYKAYLDAFSNKNYIFYFPSDLHLLLLNTPFTMLQKIKEGFLLLTREPSNLVTALQPVLNRVRIRGLRGVGAQVVPGDNNIILQFGGDAGGAPLYLKYNASKPEITPVGFMFAYIDYDVKGSPITGNLNSVAKTIKTQLKSLTSAINKLHNSYEDFAKAALTVGGKLPEHQLGTDYSIRFHNNDKSINVLVSALRPGLSIVVRARGDTKVEDAIKSSFQSPILKVLPKTRVGNIPIILSTDNFPPDFYDNPEPYLTKAREKFAVAVNRALTTLDHIVSSWV